MRIHKILSLAGSIALLGLGACFDDPGVDKLLDGSVRVVSFNAPSKTISEKGGAIDALIEVTKAPTEAMTVTYELATTNVTAGVDFTVETPSPVTIPAGVYSVPIKIKAIDNVNYETVARAIKLTITGVSNDEYKLQAYTTYSLSIINDDCPANANIWAGAVLVDDVGYSTNVPGTGTPSSTCNQLFVKADFVGYGIANDIKIILTPTSLGAKKGTAKVDKAPFPLGTAQYQYEGAGTYDETTATIVLDYTFYLPDGKVDFKGRNIIKK